MRSDIRNIRQIYKYGAHGDPNAMGLYIYGRRPDGRTVACKSKLRQDGSISIWSYIAKGGQLEECCSQFTPDEWVEISAAADSEQIRISNRILAARTTRLENR